MFIQITVIHDVSFLVSSHCPSFHYHVLHKHDITTPPATSPFRGRHFDCKLVSGLPSFSHSNTLMYSFVGCSFSSSSTSRGVHPWTTVLVPCLYSDHIDFVSLTTPLSSRVPGSPPHHSFGHLEPVLQPKMRLPLQFSDLPKPVYRLYHTEHKIYLLSDILLPLPRSSGQPSDNVIKSVLYYHHRTQPNMNTFITPHHLKT